VGSVAAHRLPESPAVIHRGRDRSCGVLRTAPPATGSPSWAAAPQTTPRPPQSEPESTAFPFPPGPTNPRRLDCRRTRRPPGASPRCLPTCGAPSARRDGGSFLGATASSYAPGSRELLPRTSETRSVGGNRPRWGFPRPRHRPRRATCWCRPYRATTSLRDGHDRRDPRLYFGETPEQPSGVPEVRLNLVGTAEAAALLGIMRRLGRPKLLKRLALWLHARGFRSTAYQVARFDLPIGPRSSVPPGSGSPRLPFLPRSIIWPEKTEPLSVEIARPLSPVARGLSGLRRGRA
jgi:hypothetical protein